MKLAKKHIERLKMMIKDHDENEAWRNSLGIKFVKGSIRSTERLNAASLRAVVKYLESQS